MEQKKPTYKQLEKAYDMAITDLTILWNKVMPNETYIKKDFMKKVFVKFAKERKNVKNEKVVKKETSNRTREHKCNV